MLYTHNLSKTIQEAPKDTLITNVTTAEYSEYTFIPLINREAHKLNEDALKVEIALIFRTEDRLLRSNYPNFISTMDMTCKRLEVDPNCFENNYVNMMGCIAEHLVTKYRLTQEEAVTKTLPTPLGILKSDTTLYWVFEVFIDTNFTANFKLDTYLTWFNLKIVKKHFKFDTYLDTILVPKLLTV